MKTDFLEDTYKTALRIQGYMDVPDQPLNPPEYIEKPDEDELADYYWDMQR